jgi:5'-methylthioadenosine nucleosidase
MPKKILIVMAMRGEAEPLINKLGLHKSDSPFQPMGTIRYRGQYRGADFTLLINGVDADTQMDMIGTQPATTTTLLGIQNHAPDVIFNFGTCGALQSHGSQIGDLFLVTEKIWFHTRRIPLPGWDRYGRGGYPTAGTPELALKLGLKPGVLSTTDSLDYPAIDAAEFHRVGGHVADMEGAAIAWLANIYGIPFYSIKGVTDLMDVDRKAGEQFNENFADLVEAISSAATRLINEILV